MPLPRYYTSDMSKKIPIPVYVTKQEHEALAAAASESRMSMSAYLAVAALNKAKEGK